MRTPWRFPFSPPQTFPYGRRTPEALLSPALPFSTPSPYKMPGPRMPRTCFSPTRFRRNSGRRSFPQTTAPPGPHGTAPICWVPWPQVPPAPSCCGGPSTPPLPFPFSIPLWRPSSTPDPDLTNNTAQREDPLQPAADLAITKVADTDTAAPGGLLTYTLTIANLGPATAQDVLLTDQTPGGLSRVEVSLDNGRTWTPWTGAYSLGALPAGQGRTLLLRGSLSSSAQGTLVNTAVVASSTPDPNPNSNTATSLVPVQGSTELRLTKTSPAGQSPVNTWYTAWWRSTGAASRQRAWWYRTICRRRSPPGSIPLTAGSPGGLGRACSPSAPWRPAQRLHSSWAGVVHPCAQGTITNTAVISSQTAGQSTAAVTTPVWPPQGYRPVWHGTGC